MADFDPSAYADAVEGQDQAGGGFDPKAYADAVESSSPVRGRAQAVARAEAEERDRRAGVAEPTLDAANTGAVHFARHLSFGLGDKIIAGEQALGDWGADKTGKVTLADAYRRNLGFDDKLMDQADKDHPVARWVGNGVGIAGNLAALAALAPVRAALAARGLVSPAANAMAGAVAPTLAQLAKQGAKIGALLGGIGGFGSDRSDSTIGTLLNTGFGTAFGAGTGYVTPYLARASGEGASYLGGKAQDLAGWLKVNSIHPTPKIGEAMESLAGGKVGVGRELLERGVGGLTKEGTAKQAEAALSTAGKAIGALTEAHDASGGAPIDIRPAITRGLDEAQRLRSQPFAAAKSAAGAIENVVNEYAEKYPDGDVPASVALAMKRELQTEAYGASQQLNKSGDQLSGHYSKAVAEVAKTLDDSMDSTIGPKFEAANLAFRRLLGGSNAADRQAARVSANHLIGLLPAVVGSGELAAGLGGEKAGAAALAVMLANKYGSQAGARLLYSPMGGGLNLAGQALDRGLPGTLSGSVGGNNKQLSASLSSLLQRSAGTGLAGGSQ